MAALAACAMALPAAAQDAYLVGITGRADRTAVEHIRAGGRCLAHLYRSRQRGRRRQRKKIKLVIEDDGAQPSKAAANTKKLITQDNVVLMVNASLSSTYAPVIAKQKRRRPAAVRKRCLSAKRLPACRSAAVLHHGLRFAVRQSRDARFRQSDGEGPVKIGILRHGDPSLARRDGLRHGAFENDGHRARLISKSSRRRPPTTRRSQPS